MRPVLGVLVCTVLLAAATVPSAVAAPAPTISEVRARVNALNEQTEAATERYNAIREDIAGLGVRLDAAWSRVEEARAGLVWARADLARWVVQTYEAGDLATVSLLLSDDPDQVLGAGTVLTSVVDRRADLVEGLLKRLRTVVASTTDLEEQQQILRERQRELESIRKDVESGLAEARRELSRLTGDQRARLAADENRQDRRGLSDRGVVLPAGRPTCVDLPMGPFDARVSKVIAYACAQVGDRYRWGASGPDRFDCSGLTMTAWKQAGVWLPHNAAMQAKLGTPVSRADLRPGDLVFFYDPIGHNGIYIGNGLMIHAPRTGDSVKIAPVDGIRSLTTAVRL